VELHQLHSPSHPQSQQPPPPIIYKYKCVGCNKKYKSYSGLWGHTKGGKCKSLYSNEVEKGSVGSKKMIEGGYIEHVKTVSKKSKNIFMELFDIIDSHKQAEYGYIRPSLPPSPPPPFEDDYKMGTI
jgi:hypothetical protein